MRKFLSLIFFTIFFVIILSSCQIDFQKQILSNKLLQNTGIVEPLTTSSVSVLPEDVITSHTLVMNVKYRLTSLESSKILYGVYTNIDIDNRIKDFEIEEIEGISHNNIDANHYVYEYVLGTQFNEEFLLDCIASNKDAYIKVIASDYNKYDIVEIYTLVNELKNYNINYFIELFPNPDNQDSSNKYVAHFNKSSEIFKKNIKNCAIIFTPNKDELIAQDEYYPNIDAYDFVGYEYVGYINDDELYDDFFNKFNYVYYENYLDKPIFITTFAISYYSKIYSTYYVNENISKINEIFDKIENNYYRVKGVNFYNITNSEDFFENDKYIYDNYNIVENEKINENFIKLISSDNFENEYEFKGDIFSEKFTYNAILVNDTYYVDDRILENVYISKMNYDIDENSYIFNKKTFINTKDLFKINENYSVYFD